MAKTGKKVKDQESSKLPVGLQRALATRKQSADSDALLTDIIDAWGGTRQLALDLFNEFQGAAKGGQNRQRIMEMIQRLIVNNTTHQIGTSQAPSDMTDAELEEVALAYTKRVIADGSAPPTT